MPIEKLEYKPDWESAQKLLIQWWAGEGPAIYITERRKKPRFDIDKPHPSGEIKTDWIDPKYRLARSEYEMAWHNYLDAAFPYFDTQIGPGSLGILLGSKPHFVEETVWYYPVIDDPEHYGEISFQPQDNKIWDHHLTLIRMGLNNAKNRYLVGIPDLIENLDTLAALRGDQNLLFDLIERPEWVLEKLGEINLAYYDVFDRMYELVKDFRGGNAFSAFKIWGPGKTAKLQCDISATLSPEMFRQFVIPYLSEQCDWLDYSLYHLDGTNSLQQLDNLLSIPALNAIEWTPQAGKPGGGSPDWYPLYTKIKEGGKSVQAVGVSPEEVIPLIKAVGPEGIYILLDRSLEEDEAHELLGLLENYR